MNRGSYPLPPLTLRSMLILPLQEGEGTVKLTAQNERKNINFFVIKIARIRLIG
jgi:hypothetical protein